MQVKIGLWRSGRTHACASSLSVVLVISACGGAPTDDGTDATGGTGTIDGQAGSGGQSSSGGQSASGGQGNTGGVANTGGQFGSTGGNTNTGGSTDGGSPGSGGDAAGGTGTGGALPEFFVGNITTWDQVDTSGLVFSDYWDQITPENAGKWGSVQQTPGGQFNWQTLDAIYDYAESKGIIFKQHAFVWGSQQPSGTPTGEQVEQWIQSFCERYPATRMIDVVNEPPPHTNPNYTNNLGGGTNGNWQWVATAFEMAREHCPGAILLLNDFNNIEWDTDSNHFIGIVQAIQALGAPIDAVGAQSHDLDHGSVSFQKVQGLLQKLHDDTGLPVYITEFDISTTNDQEQLQKYQQYMPYFQETDFIPGVTIWGWIRGRTWSAAPESGLVSQQGVSRPAMTYLMDLLGRPSP